MVVSCETMQIAQGDATPSQKGARLCSAEAMIEAVWSLTAKTTIDDEREKGGSQHGAEPSNI